MFLILLRAAHEIFSARVQVSALLSGEVRLVSGQQQQQQQLEDVVDAALTATLRQKEGKTNLAGNKTKAKKKAKKTMVGKFT